MKRKPLVAIIAIHLIAILSGMLSSLAQTPVPNKATNQQSTSELTISILSHFKSVYSIAATATDQASAKKAVASINQELDKVDALSPLLNKASAPSVSQMNSVAEATAKMEIEMAEIIKQLSQNLTNKEVRTLIHPSMQDFLEKSNKLRSTMNKLFPAKKMKPLVEAAKARIKIQKKP